MVAFLRLSTHPRVLARPVSLAVAWDVVKGWLERPNVQCPTPTERHADIFARLLLDAGAGANHVPDAHLAALAIEWAFELVSADGDFARYRGLRWRNPLASTGAA
jgi:toxin-antitoxin system PIN domain toxin